jgi:signal peptidase I
MPLTNTTQQIVSKRKFHLLLADKEASLQSSPTETLGAVYFCAHVGPSMNPTLCQTDLLEIQPYREENPKVGDVILFLPPNHDYYVVHRIVSLSTAGIKTRGDNCSNVDSWFLKRENIYGRVIAAHRGETSRKIANGFMGMVARKFCQIRRVTIRLLAMLLGPVYRYFSVSGLLRWLIPSRLHPQVASFKSNNNDSYKLIVGKWVIGFYDDTQHKWQIKRPYRLIVNESSLPTPR